MGEIHEGVCGVHQSAFKIKWMIRRNGYYWLTILDFGKEHIVYRFGIPQTITIDQGTMFTSGEFDKFAIGMGIKVLNSSPYYAQANGQVKASNKGIIKLIKQNIEGNPRRWHTLLNEAIWSYRMACHGATKVSPYQLVYGHDAVLPWEIKTGSR